jgi:hypothetical protein
MQIELFLDMPASRPAYVCLGLQGHSVFVDFDLDSEGRLYLVRISFDGYGCCTAPAEIGRFSKTDSQTLVAMRAGRYVPPEQIEPILRAYFQQHRDLLWPDALERHGLL